MKINLTLIAGALVFLACEKKQMVAGNGILEAGIWVEATHRMDTITFQSFENGDTWLTLNRERETRNGQQVPRTGAGIYQYRLNEGEISLYYTLSSYYAFEDYRFHHTGTKFQIGDFYEGTENMKTFIQVRQ
ncbi:hypothetical protein [Parapedobacter sp. DT-150]|uniref:hypothetical protein n=1 Tax=Parapedobacter sp. DT-150 TaxID=3396162 RepID=UPI003F1C7ED3